ncbi:MAG: hypothetical protein ACI8X5_004217 [Planctomycetota bacterium]|jgi:hypothetical protein
MKKHYTLAALLVVASSSVFATSIGMDNWFDVNEQDVANAPVITPPSRTASFPADCTPTGQVIVEYSEPVFGSVSCVESEYLEVCDGGVKILKKFSVCITESIVTITTTTVKVDEFGNDCSTVSLRYITEKVANTTAELGPFCPSAPNICCEVVGSGWNYEWAPLRSPPEISQSTSPIECRDGTPGTETTTVIETYKDRRVISWTESEAIGNCDGSEVCGRIETPGPWVPELIGTDTTTSNDCLSASVRIQ